MKRYVSVAVVAFLAAAAVIGVAAADAGPLADAGLDQEVGANTTVQLDGTGSSGVCRLRSDQLQADGAWPPQRDCRRYRLGGTVQHRHALRLCQGFRADRAAGRRHRPSDG
ncbi:hypothetical protein BRD02_03355 [Halobacteriales archaeon QS_8_69_73]|nr:MAG: hypothetical protein BRD02_03355 [Halobacteriales archaeon QS_8_69_73]